MIYGKYFGGMEWRRIFRNLWLSIQIVKKWMLSIKILEFWPNILLFLLENRKIWIFISLWFTAHPTSTWLDFGYSKSVDEMDSFYYIQGVLFVEDYNKFYLREILLYWLFEKIGVLVRKTFWEKIHDFKLNSNVLETFVL